MNPTEAVHPRHLKSSRSDQTRSEPVRSRGYLTRPSFTELIFVLASATVVQGELCCEGRASPKYLEATSPCNEKSMKRISGKSAVAPGTEASFSPIFHSADLPGCLDARLPSFSFVPPSSCIERISGRRASFYCGATIQCKALELRVQDQRGGCPTSLNTFGTRNVWFGSSGSTPVAANHRVVLVFGARTGNDYLSTVLFHH